MDEAPEDILNHPVEKLELPLFVLRLLAKDDIDTIGALVQRTDQELLRIPGCGRLSINKIIDALERCGLKLAGGPHNSVRSLRSAGDLGAITLPMSIDQAEQLYRCLRQALKAAGRIKEP